MGNNYSKRNSFEKECSNCTYMPKGLVHRHTGKLLVAALWLNCAPVIYPNCQVGLSRLMNILKGINNGDYLNGKYKDKLKY